MPVPPAGGPVRRLHFPRPTGGLATVPFHALMGWGFGDPDAVVGRAPYDPFQFVAPPDRERVSRTEAHRRAVAGVVARRAELGIS